MSRLAVLCSIAIILAVRGPDLFGSDTVLRTFTSWAGIAGTILTLPAAIATVTAKAGSLLARQGRTYGLPGTLVAGRRARAHPGGTARLVTGVSIALIVLMQAIAWQGLFGAQTTEARRTLDRIGRSLVTVGARGDVSASAMAAFFAGAPATEAVLLTPPDRDKNEKLTLYGDCAALTALHLPCPAHEVRVDRLPADPRLRELIRWTPHMDPTLLIRRTDDRRLAELAAPDGTGATLAVLRPDGKSLSVPALKRLSHEVFPRGAAIRAPGEGLHHRGPPAHHPVPCRSAALQRAPRPRRPDMGRASHVSSARAEARRMTKPLMTGPGRRRRTPSSVTTS
ncbi:hypothetical protein [Streptomyces tanashiensis]|uniref:hypothetical protein n=1 Tax=Streptomyces tanashiensis TaxID=67367 RepID=UPI0033D681FD